MQVLVFVRDPIEHALSLWQQRVKPSGAPLSRDEFFDTYEHPARVLRISQRLAELPVRR